MGEWKGSGSDGGGEVLSQPTTHCKIHLNAIKYRKLFFVTADIEKCYDTMKSSKLLEVVDTICKAEDYLVRKVSVISPVECNPRPKAIVSKVLSLVTPFTHGLQSFVKVAGELAER